MRIKIDHHTKYTYDKAVFVEPLHLYFIPQNRNHIELIDFQCAIKPKASGTGQRLDAENNRYIQCWFNDSTDQLQIDISMMVEVSPLNQFDFLVEDSSKTPYSKAIEMYLEDKLDLEPDIKDWAEQLTLGDPIQYLSSLCTGIHAQWNHTTSYSPDLRQPNETFNASAASCRDLAWMMIHMLRHKGFPSRFVSGYSYNPELEGHELHAWVEAWVNGAGWISLDPSSGLFTTETYIPIATSYHPKNTLPVQGSYRGEAKSELVTNVELSVIHN